MATYAIGDIQGCYDELRILLDSFNFDPQSDKLWLVGDLVNRGRQSLAVLRFVKGLEQQAVTVLGNHDMHLLAVAQGNLAHYHDDSLDEILAAPDREELLDWLRYRPLMYYSPEKDISLIHAGLPPHWSLETAQTLAQEVESVLRGNSFAELMHGLYGNQPHRWADTLTGLDRYRFIINCFTRLRYCHPDGTLGLKEKGPPGTQAHGLLPWFDIPGRVSSGKRIICGHWSTLGFTTRNNVWSLDTGCLWGGQLTALRVHKRKLMTISQIDCPDIAKPLAYLI